MGFLNDIKYDMGLGKSETLHFCPPTTTTHVSQIKIHLKVVFIQLLSGSILHVTEEMRDAIDKLLGCLCCRPLFPAEAFCGEFLRERRSALEQSCQFLVVFAFLCLGFA